MPEFTARQRIVKAALAQAMREDLVGGMVHVSSVEEIPEATDTINSDLIRHLTEGKKVTVLIIPES
jgi:hypothetical protein